MNIILFGPQGSGKGTQAELIAKKYKLTTVEMGGILRDKIAEKNDRSKLINSLINQKGKLLPDGIVIELVKEFLANYKSKKGYIFDGYPRNIKQFILLEDTLAEMDQFIHLAIYLDIPDKISIERLSNRFICSKCGNIYNSITNPPPQKKTCKCGGKLTKREDDQPAAIKTRLSLFHEATEPLLKHLEDKHILERIDATPSPQSIFNQVTSIIDEKIKR